jgi:hypothetical protein
MSNHLQAKFPSKICLKAINSVLQKHFARKRRISLTSLVITISCAEKDFYMLQMAPKKDPIQG